MKTNQSPVTSASANGRPEGGDFFVPTPGVLSLADGTSFPGFIPAHQAESVVGEVVFNTGMTGYVETLTDPSYTGQILVFTSPLMGNYGVTDESSWESARVHLRGVVVSELTADWSHAGATMSLYEWLHRQGVPVISGVDTRALTKHLRAAGTMAGQIASSAPDELTTLPPAPVQVPPAKTYNADAPKTIIAVDCGMKENIVRHLVGLGLTVKRVPHTYDYSGDEFDGVFISNGPGDPTDYPEAIATLARVMELNKPVFGICLGAQLMALAAGGKTYKLKFGHRGHNQPAITPEGRAFITSQNHGYAVERASLPSDWHVNFTNLNDDSVEGIAHNTKPFFAVQFHPEAAPGPTDTTWLFTDFKDML